MKITKYGHCCLLIDINGVRFLTDPGSYSTMQSEARDVDVILITHDHPDHLHVSSLKEILENNSNAKVVTNPTVGKILSDYGIEYHSVADGEHIDIKGVLVEGFGAKHHEVYKELGQTENTGYFIDNKLFYPGDAFYVPGKSVDILALPVAGPWCNIHDSVEYALKVHPRVAFPVHDANLHFGYGVVHRAPSEFLPKNGIEFVVVGVGETKEL
jgi:L-ascorbate metabolism protein UlaG (beta-lactamase superfamily)